MFLVEARRLIVVFIGSFLLAVSLNFFLIEANVYASGFTGAAQLLASIFNDYFNIPLSTGILLFLFNVPVFILGWFKVGKGFTIYSIASVMIATIFLEVLPIFTLTDDIILNAVAGGVIGGAGVGMTLKWGASTGGLDIVAMVLARLNDRPIGIYFLLLNGIIIVVAGSVYEPENALYTLLTLYITIKVIDTIHTSQEKLTVMIITEKPVELQQAIHDQMVRGITILKAEGAYTKTEKHMLYLVITRYELYGLEQIIKRIDSKAFTNIVQTTEVIGSFRRQYKKTADH